MTALLALLAALAQHKPIVEVRCFTVCSQDGTRWVDGYVCFPARAGKTLEECLRWGDKHYGPRLRTVLPGPCGLKET